MKLSYGNLVRYCFLALFVLSCILGLFKPTLHTALVAVLSIGAFVCFDLVCAFKRPKYKDFSEEFAELSKRMDKNEEIAKELKADYGLAKAGNIFSNRK